MPNKTDDFAKALRTARLIQQQFKAIQDIGHMLEMASGLNAEVVDMENRKVELSRQVTQYEQAAKEAETISLNAISESNKKLEDIIELNAEKLKAFDDETTRALEASTVSLEKATKSHAENIARLDSEISELEKTRDNLLTQIGRIDTDMEDARASAKRMLGRG